MKKILIYLILISNLSSCNKIIQNDCENSVESELRIIRCFDEVNTYLYNSQDTSVVDKHSGRISTIIDSVKKLHHDDFSLYGKYILTNKRTIDSGIIKTSDCTQEFIYKIVDIKECTNLNIEL